MVETEFFLTTRSWPNPYDSMLPQRDHRLSNRFSARPRQIVATSLKMFLKKKAKAPQTHYDKY